jgi:hypothetical protein
MASAATTFALCCALCANDRFCFAFNRDLPDVVQCDMVVVVVVEMRRKMLWNDE